LKLLDAEAIAPALANATLLLPLGSVITCVSTVLLDAALPASPP
jgi:hypothetical protein